MKKRLLLAALAFVCAAGTYAYDDGDYAYTKTGRVKVEGSNLFENSLELDGWTDAEGNAVDGGTWAVEPGVGLNGENAIASQGATEGAALCKVLTLDAGTYVVSYQIRATGETVSGSTTIGTTVGNNYADIFINTDASTAKVASTDDAPVINIAAAENFTTEWKTFNYFFTIEDGQYLILHFEKMATGIQLTNFSVNAASEVYDDRIVNNKLAYVRQLLDDPNFNTPQAADQHDYLVDDVIPQIEEQIEGGALDDISAAEDMLAGLDDALNDYLDATAPSVNSLLTGTSTETLTATGKVNRGDNNALNKYFPNLNLTGGNWQHGSNADYLFTAIQGNYTNSGNYEVYHEDFPAGKYFITFEIRNAYVGNSSTYVYTWTLETMCNIFVGDTKQEIGPIVGEDYQRFYLVGEVGEDGQFRAGVEWPGYTKGSAFFIRNVEVRAFDTSITDKVEHIQAFKTFRTQWNAATSARNNVIQRQSDNNYPWDKQVLADARTKYDPYYTAQAAKGWLTADGADAGIATTDEFNDWALYQGVEEYNEPTEEGAEPTRKTYQVVRGYQNAFNAVGATNKPFIDLATAIDAAKKTRNQGANLTGNRDAYKAAILKAIDTIKEIRDNTTDAKREEDTARLEAALAELNQATEDFLNSVSLPDLVNIDFSLGAQQNADGFYVAAGDPGEMVFSGFQPDSNTQDTNFTLGHNEAYTDVLRVGNGTGTVTLPEIPTPSDALTIQFDIFHGNLSGKSAYVDLRNASGVRVAGFSLNRFNGSVAYNEFNDVLTNGGTGMNILAYATGVGSSSASNQAIAAENNRTSYTLVINYKNNTVQGTISNPQKGTCEGAELPMPQVDDNIITQFVIGSNYGNNDRRCWFDNLRIVKYSLDAASADEDILVDGWADAQGIATVAADKAAGSNAIYTISGVRVNSAAQKGIYIQNGRKFIVK